MMATHQSDIIDPMYNFDTHFPERLSRLHVHGDTFAPTQTNFRKKKTRANRNAARYKTQPVTFDEILEVDEEPNPAASQAAKDLDKRRSHDERLLDMNKLQAFSKSLDGLVPSALSDHVRHNVNLGRSGSFSRTGSRKYYRHPESIPEKVETEALPKSPRVQQNQEAPRLKKEQETPEQRLADAGDENLSGGGSTTSSLKVDVSAASKAGAASPIPSPNVASRRQKMTAKAKKRQKAQGEGEGS